MFSALMFCMIGCAYIDDNDEKKRLDPDGDGVLWPNDCDDNDATIADQQAWYEDNDADGHGNSQANPIFACSKPVAYVAQADDCDDSNPDVHPLALEVCDGIDNDCDGFLDDSDDNLEPTQWFEDADADGFGNPNVTHLLMACEASEGYTRNGDDCDDSNPNTHPGAAEVCDHVDNNCDGFDVDVPVKQALYLHGNDAHMIVSEPRAANVPLLNMGMMNFTFEAWIKNAEPSDSSTIFAKYNTAEQVGLMIFITNGLIDVYMAAGSAISEPTVNCFGETLVNDGEWHHIAVSVLRGSHMFIAVDGVQDQLCPLEQDPMLPIENHDPAYVGLFMWDGNPSATYRGYIDDIKIWQQAANIEHIANNRCGYDPQPNLELVGHWDFESSAQDLSPYENHGELVDGAVLVALPADL